MIKDYHFKLTKLKDPSHVYSFRVIDLEPSEAKKEQYLREMELYKKKIDPKYVNFDKNNPPLMPKIEITTANELLKVSISDSVALKNPRWKICEETKWSD